MTHYCKCGQRKPVEGNNCDDCTAMMIALALSDDVVIDNDDNTARGVFALLKSKCGLLMQNNTQSTTAITVGNGTVIYQPSRGTQIIFGVVNKDDLIGIQTSYKFENRCIENESDFVVIKKHLDDEEIANLVDHLVGWGTHNGLDKARTLAY